jgi:3-methylcrotonyl-CoA carboxylase alpha subunit
MHRVLIANRGEIAVRIARACREQGLASVSVYSDADRDAPHVRAADDAVAIGPAPARESYLRSDALLEAARATRADAVHPGYGFLAENAAFARAVGDAGLTWVGPPPEAIATMGDKVAARATAARAGVPVVPGVDAVGDDAAVASRHAAALGYPVLVKAAAGGGGKGMRVVTNEGELGEALAAAAREAGAAFADPRVYLEKLILRPRHVEVQVLGDRHGTLLHLGERECSVQRRHQKVVEETPCPVMTPGLRAEITAAALAVARAVDYSSAGTVEFLLDDGGRFYFLEMNTRLQVEHPVTEWVTGIDLVAAQLRVARGDPLGFTQADVTSRGHAIEVRLCAEDPAAGFLPSAGRILLLREPAGPGVRVDSGMEAGVVVPVEYDPLLAKISAWAPERTQAARRLRAALCDTVVLGPATNLGFLQDVLAHPAFVAGATHTGFLDEHCASWRPDAAEVDAAAAIAALAGVALPPGAPGKAGPSAPPSAWETLGRWRLGA